mgnify:CR=1 FL=1
MQALYFTYRGPGISNLASFSLETDLAVRRVLGNAGEAAVHPVAGAAGSDRRMTANGSIEKINGQWYIFYHRHTNGTNFSRQGCLEPVRILPDGAIPQVELTSCGGNGGPLKGGGEDPARRAPRGSPRWPRHPTGSGAGMPRRSHAPLRRRGGRPGSQNI